VNIATLTNPNPPLVSFHHEGETIATITPDGLTWKGVLHKDAGEIHAAMLKVLRIVYGGVADE